MGAAAKLQDSLASSPGSGIIGERRFTAHVAVSSRSIPGAGASVMQSCADARGSHPADLPPGSPEGLIFRGIHPSVVVLGGATIQFPESTIIEPFCSFIMGPYASLALGENVTIYSGCAFRSKYGDLRIGSEVSFGPNCAFYELRAGLTIGDYTMIGAGVCVSGVNHGMDPDGAPYRFQNTDNRPVHIGRNVWIGMNSTILPGVSIGDNSIIGAGSVVTKDIPESVVAFGHPCRVVRPAGKPLLARRDHS